MQYFADQALRRQLVESRDRLYRVALAWCGDAMLADDLVQETLLAGIANRGQLRDRSRFFSWLYGILYHKWQHHLRDSRAHLPIDEQMPSQEDGPLVICQELELAERVRRAVWRLSREQREVIALVDLEGFAYCEVAEMLEIPIGTVMSRLYRARRQLVALLNGASGAPGKVRRLRRVK